MFGGQLKKFLAWDGTAGYTHGTCEFRSKKTQDNWYLGSMRKKTPFGLKLWRPQPLLNFKDHWDMTYQERTQEHPGCEHNECFQRKERQFWKNLSLPKTSPHVKELKTCVVWGRTEKPSLRTVSLQIGRHIRLKRLSTKRITFSRALRFLAEIQAARHRSYSSSHTSAEEQTKI